MASAASVQMRSAWPSYSSTTIRATAWIRSAIEPGNRCTAGGSAHSDANCSGSAAAICAGSRLPNRSRIFAGPANACSIGYCWSRSMPHSSANGESVEHLVGVLVAGDVDGHPAIMPTGCPGGSAVPCGRRRPVRRRPTGRVATMDPTSPPRSPAELRAFVTAAGTRRALPTTCHVGHPGAERATCPAREPTTRPARRPGGAGHRRAARPTDGACAWVTRGGELGPADADLGGSPRPAGVRAARAPLPAFFVLTGTAGSTWSAASSASGAGCATRPPAA